MDHGQLIAFGPHEDVLATCPIYERLFHARGRRVQVSAEAQETTIASIRDASPLELIEGQSIERPEILPLPLARSIRLAAQSAAPELRVDAARDSTGKRPAPPSQDAA